MTVKETQVLIADGFMWSTTCLLYTSKRAHEIDERAFVIIVESNEVIGEGFRAPGDTNLV